MAFLLKNTVYLLITLIGFIQCFFFRVKTKSVREATFGFSVFSREKIAFTDTFFSFFKHTHNFSRALCQNFSRVGSFLFYWLKLEFNGIGRENYWKVKFYENFTRARFIFHGHFLYFFHGQSIISTGTLLIFFTGRKNTAFIYHWSVDDRFF